MTDSPVPAPKILTLYLQIAQYPILARPIRQRMREELYRRGVIDAETFEQEVRAKAIDSQRREGLSDPFAEEPESVWEQRLQTVRDNLTDFYFAYNLPLELFHRIVQELIGRRGAGPAEPLGLTFNPELAPLDLLLRQLRLYESLPTDTQEQVRHHQEEITVVLIRSLVSDQLGFVHVAKGWFTAEDFESIRARRIGGGKIGGKAAGMLLAHKILQHAAPELAAHITVPRSYFLGANVFYDFKAINRLEHNQKYKSPEQIRAEYPGIVDEHLNARFPEEVTDRLRAILAEVGQTPLIVRSSSLLEDNFGTSFAGKYASYFCPNQDSPKENLRVLTKAIRRIYASVNNPDALIYRRRMGLIDYDERMAVLLQVVQGQAHGRYFFPDLAGVAFSHNSFVWHPRLRREEGFVRLVLGLGTRAVERVAEDYPRLVFLSHPQLRPEKTVKDMTHYSQGLVDVIDLELNALATVPAREVLDRDLPALRWVASLHDIAADTLRPLNSLGPNVVPERLVLTFDNLLARSSFVPLIKQALATLAQHYGRHVDVEFAASLAPGAGGRPEVTLHLLQCRPQSSLPGANKLRPLPANLPADQRLLGAMRMVPQGEVGGIQYVVYVDPNAYNGLPDAHSRNEVARLVGRVNKALEGKPFILIGPGRWGSSNVELGVPVSYADIFNARVLVELSIGPEGLAPDPSYGTHFFQDLVESGIYALAVRAAEVGARPAQADEFVNWDFLRRATNRLGEVVPEARPGPAAGCVKLIHVASERPGCALEVWMNGERALAFFAAPAG